MNTQHYYIDLEKIPEGTRINFTHVAEQHNALVNRVGKNAEGVDIILGKTDEEKKEMETAFTRLRGLLTALHSKRFNGLLLSIQGFIFIYVLKALGVDTEQTARLFEVFIKLLEKMVSIA